MTTITYTLPNFPQVNQLHEPTSDGFPDENASWNCVPASIADGLIWLTGRQYNGDELKDAVYKQDYQGPQAAADYVDYCAKQGVRLFPANGTPATLVPFVHSEIATGHPVLGTIPSQWGIPRDQQAAGYTTHVVCFCGTGPGALRADNPWIAPKWHDGDDSYWADRLCFGQVWVMEEGSTPVGIPAGWHDDGVVLTASNGKQVRMGFRDYILSHPWYAGDVPLGGETPTSSGTQQDFRYTRLTWSAATNVLEHDRLDALQGQLDAAGKQMATDDAAITALQQQITSLQQQGAKANAAQKVLDALFAYGGLK